MVRVAIHVINKYTGHCGENKCCSPSARIQFSLDIRSYYVLNKNIFGGFHMLKIMFGLFLER